MTRRLPVVLATLLLIACHRNDAPSASTSASASTPAPAQNAPWLAQRPTGPRFAVQPGVGIGPIRPGATVATLERHMQAKCERLVPGSCSYISHGLEFLLDDKGVTTKIHIHRPGRSAGKLDGGAELHWGAFNGAIPPDLVFGMLPAAIQETLGPPKRVVQGDQGAYPGTAEQHYYEKTVLEYERLPSGALALAGIRIPD